MRNLLRAAFICILVWSVTSVGGADTLGTCRVRCTSEISTPGFLSVTVQYVSEGECCGSSDFFCPPGYTGWPYSWNGARC